MEFAFGAEPTRHKLVSSTNREMRPVRCSAKCAQVHCSRIADGGDRSIRLTDSFVWRARPRTSATRIRSPGMASTPQE